MKILITGANGMLAKSVKAKLGNEHELTCTDVADLDKIRKLVEASGEDERCEFAHFEPRTKSLRIK